MRCHLITLVFLICSVAWTEANSITYYISQSGNDYTGCGETPLDPCQTINHVIQLAQVSKAYANVILADGTYSGKGQTGLLFTDRSFSLTAANANFASISCSSSVRWLNLTRGNVTLSGLNIKNCGGSTITGGALQAEDAFLNIDQCVFQDNYGNNKAYLGGGAIAIFGGNTTITESSFLRNSASVGGAIWLTAGARYIIDSCTFVSNQARQWGGALNFDSHAIGEMIDITVQESTGYQFGALAFFNCTADLSGSSSFNRNNATIHGGAILIDQDTVISMTGVTFNANHAEQYGGAIYLRQNAFMTGKNLVFAGNSALRGGAITGRDNSYAHLKSGEFEDNKAIQEGGALYYWEQASIVLQQSTLNANKSPRGGGFLASMDSTVALLSTECLKHSEVSDGGCAFGSDRANITMFNANVTENDVVGQGGGIYLEGKSSLHVRDTVFDHNDASSGGAIHAAIQSYVYVSDSVFDSNHALQGGAISYSGFLFIELNNLTVFQNNWVNSSRICRGKDGYGGAILSFTQPSIHDIYDDPVDSGFIVFKNNSAQTAGGAVYIVNPEYGSGYLCAKKERCYFHDNHAPYGADISSIPFAIVVHGSTVIDFIPGFVIDPIRISVIDFFNNTLAGANHMGIKISLTSSEPDAVSLIGDTSLDLEGSMLEFSNMCLSISMDSYHNETVIQVSSIPELPKIALTLKGMQCPKGYLMGRTSDLEPHTDTAELPMSSSDLFLLPSTSARDVDRCIVAATSDDKDNDVYTQMNRELYTRFFPDSALAALHLHQELQEDNDADWVCLDQGGLVGWEELAVGAPLGVLVLGVFVSAGCIGYHRKKRQLMRHTPFLMILSLFGCFLCAVSILFSIMNQALWVCYVKAWTLHCGFTIFFMCLIIKAWRLDKIFNNRKLLRIRISTNDMLKRVFAVLLVDICILTIVGIVYPYSLSPSTNQCHHEHYPLRQILMTTLIVEKVFILAFGLKLMYNLRQSPSTFDDTFALTLTICNSLFAGLFILFISVFMAEDTAYYTLTMIQLLAYLEALLFALVVYFGPKLLSLLRPASSGYRSNDEKFTLSLHSVAKLVGGSKDQQDYLRKSFSALHKNQVGYRRRAESSSLDRGNGVEYRTSNVTDSVGGGVSTQKMPTNSDEIVAQALTPLTLADVMIPSGVSFEESRKSRQSVEDRKSAIDSIAAIDPSILEDIAKKESTILDHVLRLRRLEQKRTETTEMIAIRSRNLHNLHWELEFRRSQKEKVAKLAEEASSSSPGFNIQQQTPSPHEEKSLLATNSRRASDSRHLQRGGASFAVPVNGSASDLHVEDALQIPASLMDVAMLPSDQLGSADFYGESSLSSRGALDGMGSVIERKELDAIIRQDTGHGYDDIY